MAAPDPMTLSYATRLAAVNAALERAEAEQRFGDAQSLRLARAVLLDLVNECELQQPA